jgi:hypothetical protein
MAHARHGDGACSRNNHAGQGPSLRGAPLDAARLAGLVVAGCRARCRCRGIWSMTLKDEDVFDSAYPAWWIAPSRRDISVV